MISKTAKYAIRIVLALAELQGSPVFAKDIALQTGIPLDYLYKAISPLIRAKIVRSKAGKNGGYSLCQGAGNLSVLEIIKNVSVPHAYPLCSSCRENQNAVLCPLHESLYSASQLFYEKFSNLFVSQILTDGK